MSQPIATLSPAVYSPGHFEGSFDFENEPAHDGRVESSGEGLTFGELFDIINPLQHLPVVSTIYRAVTGDEISVGARAVGALIYGGPLGLVSSGVTAAIEEASGGSVADHALALVDKIRGPDLGAVGAFDVSKAIGDTAPASVSTIAAGAAALATSPAAALATQSVATSVQTGAIAPAHQALQAPFTVSRGRQSVGISQSLLAAQRAQVDLLLANLGNVGLAPVAADASKPNGEGSATKPQSHSGTPAWFPMAMQKALDKYQSSQGLTGSLIPRTR